MVTTTDTVPQQLLLLLHYSLEIITTQLLLLYPFANNCVFKVGGMRYLSCAQVYPILIFLLSQSVFERRVAHFNLWCCTARLRNWNANRLQLLLPPLSVPLLLLLVMIMNNDGSNEQCNEYLSTTRLDKSKWWQQEKFLLDSKAFCSFHSTQLYFTTSLEVNIKESTTTSYITLLSSLVVTQLESHGGFFFRVFCDIPNTLLFGGWLNTEHSDMDTGKPKMVWTPHYDKLIITVPMRERKQTHANATVPPRKPTTARLQRLSMNDLFQSGK